MGLTVSRREGYFFYRQPSKMHSNINRHNVLTISADLHGLLAPEESLHLKNHWPYCQNTLSEHYKTLQLCYVLKYLDILKKLCERPRQPPQHNS